MDKPYKTLYRDVEIISKSILYSALLKNDAENDINSLGLIITVN